MIARRQFLKRAGQAFAWTGLLWLPKAQQSYAFPRARQFAKPTSAASDCTTQNDANETGASNFSVGNASTRTYVGCLITAGSDYTCCGWSARLDNNSTSPTFSVYASIWSDTGTNPTASLAESSALDSATITSSYDWYKFTLSVALTSGTGYWLVLRCSATDASNYIRWRYDNAGAGTVKTDADGAGSWATSDASALMYFKTWS